MVKAYFKINDVEVGFANHPTEGTSFLKGALDSEVIVRRGKLRINLLTPSLDLTKQLHNGLLDDPGYDGYRQVDWLRFVTYHDVAVPNGQYDNTIQCPYAKRLSGFEVYGFPEDVTFHGQIDVQEGHIHIKGALVSIYDKNLPQVPIEIVKDFEAVPLLPQRKSYTLDKAQKADPLEVYDLSIGKGQYDAFPEKVLEFKNLERLWVGAQAHFNFASLPASFYDLRQLHTLQIYSSKLTTIDDNIKRLRNLEELTIERAPLAQVPDSIGELPVLDTISFKYGSLKSLPESIGNIPALKHLNIEGNAFKSLPQSLAKIQGLNLDRKHRKLIFDTAYKIDDGQPIDEALYDLSHYAVEKKQLKAAIAELPDLKEFSGLIEDYTTMATYLVCKDDKENIPVGASKVGGEPDLPEDWEHPANKQGRLYVFHAQINCEEVGPYQKYLPRTGMLYFFVNDEEYAQKPMVLYAEKAENLKRVQYTEATEFTDSDLDGDYRKGVGVTFQNAPSVPIMYNTYNHGEERYPKYAALWEDEDDEALYDKIDALEEYIEQLGEKISTPSVQQGALSLSSHSINSAVFTQHESPQEIAAAKYGGEPNEWLVLLNMESIGAFNFWDAGTLTYCIHKKALAALDFTKVSTSIESS